MKDESNSQEVWARNAGSFDKLYHDNGPRLRAFLQQMVGSFQTAEDLAQEVFTQLWRYPESFNPSRGSLRSFLFAMGRHRAADWWRRQKPQATLLDDRCAACNPESESMMANALAHLPEEQRALLWLREVEGQSYAELALILDIPLGTVRSRLFMARQALRQIWIGQDKGEFHEVR